LIFPAVDIASGVFRAARGSDPADQLTVGWFVWWSHDFFAKRQFASGKRESGLIA
jgi:hypothetical protein